MNINRYAIDGEIFIYLNREFFKVDSEFSSGLCSAEPSRSELKPDRLSKLQAKYEKPYAFFEPMRLRPYPAPTTTLQCWFPLAMHPSDLHKRFPSGSL